MHLSNNNSKAQNPPRSESFCEAIVSVMGNYLAGSLAPATGEVFEHHLRLCSDCAALLRTYKKTIEVTQAFLRAQAPSSGHRARLRRDQHVHALTALTLWLHLFLFNLSLIVG